MRTRITTSHLLIALDGLNASLGIPITSPDSYCLYHAYGAVRLCRGDRIFTPLLTKRELLGRIYAMTDGVRAARAAQAAEDARIAALRDERDGDALMQDWEIAATL
jgi:hypothetical protein